MLVMSEYFTHKLNTFELKNLCKPQAYVLFDGFVCYFVGRLEKWDLKEIWHKKLKKMRSFEDLLTAG